MTVLFNDLFNEKMMSSHHDFAQRALREADNLAFLNEVLKKIQLNEITLNVNSKGLTLLHVAASSRHDIGLVKLLIEKGMNVNQIDDDATPLHFAVTDGHLESVRLLVEAGALPSIEMFRLSLVYRHNLHQIAQIWDFLVSEDESLVEYFHRFSKEINVPIKVDVESLIQKLEEFDVQRIQKKLGETIPKTLKNNLKFYL